MVSSRKYLTAIALLSTITALRTSGELLVLRHSPTNNSSIRQLTCVSEDDDSALVWNHNPKESDFTNARNVFTNFEPKKPTPKYISECAVWNSTRCLVKWGNISGWSIANSAMKPMGPVFDYRWEGFEEFVSEKFSGDQEYQYVGKVNESSGTAVFSVRGLRDFYIFLCENEAPCFWIIIGGGRRGKRSAIRSCIAKEGRNCVDIASVMHKTESVIDAYEWRTFRLEWNNEDKTIKIFKEIEVDPFLKGKVSEWHRVSDLSIQSEISSRVRFHFYEYFLAEKANAVISTEEFFHLDKNFCVELIVGLCPECELDVTLVDSNDEDIPIASISGVENSFRNKLLTWRSVRLNATLPNINSGLVKLRVVTSLTKDGVEGLWAIDNFRRCKSIVGLRESTITTHREMLASAFPFWPKVKCQKLSYTASSVVDSRSSSSYPGTNLAHVSKAGGDSLLSRKARGSDDLEGRFAGAKLDAYEGDPEDNTISLRLSPLNPAEGEIDEYSVYIVRGPEQDARVIREVSEGLICTLWEDSVCFENYKLPSTIELAAQTNDAYQLINIKVDGIRKGGTMHTWQTVVSLNFYAQTSSAPTYLHITSQTHGIMTMTWGHPLSPNRKIEGFQIIFSDQNTKLLEYEVTLTPITTQVEKVYKMDLHLRTSTEYFISVAATRQGGKVTGAKVSDTIWVPSGVAFANGEKLEMEKNGSSIQLKPPRVVNATYETSIRVIVKGPVTCTLEQSPSTNMTEWEAAEYKVVDDDYVKGNWIVIGGNQPNKMLSNCTLHRGETYVLEVQVTDEDSRNRSSDILTSSRITISDDSIDDPTSSEGSGQILTWIVIILIVVFCLLILYIWYRRRRKASMEIDEQEIMPVSNTDHLKAASDPEHSTPPSELTNHKSSTQQSAPDVVPYNYPDSHSVKVEDFEEYVKEALASGLLDSQYEKFPRGLTKPCKYGTLPDNVQKNRYKDTTAYDHSRVVLDKVTGDLHSDYINANYIQGYYKKNAYIAAQGPKATTVRDFWRMIWQNKVRVICMLANVKEDGKTKCEKYWPEVGSNAKYGDVIITNKGHQVFADYTFRNFRLDCKDAKRNVTHLHYTGWPDHGVPMYTQSLVSYLKKLRETDTGNAPVVIHCSAGVGRTGTIILCDVCLSQANETKMIDVPTVMAKMREDRMNMVDSKQQYLLAHLTIVESMLPAPTQLPCNRVLEAKIKELRVQLPSDIQRLNDTVWQDRALHSLAVSRRPEEVAKDQIPDQSTGSQGEAESQSSSTIDTEDYDIDAVSVDGVEMKKQYLASRLPSSSTLPGFWKLIAEKRIELVVILQRPDPNDPTFCDIIPTESVTTPASHIQVEAKILPIQDDFFSVNKLLLTDSSREEVKPQPVTVLTCTGWACCKEGNPPTATALVSLWRASEKISRKESPTLVLCCDGVTGCGLYLALSFLLERMAVERECDVISAVRAVRRSNPEFVQKLTQFEYLYDAAMSFIKCFDTYSNFS